MIASQVLCDLYKDACELELLAFKPGNVSVYADGHDMTVSDFRISAEASSASLGNRNYCLGEKIYHAVRLTRAEVGCNTNLGIVLLCAPLMQAFEHYGDGFDFRFTLAKVLDNTTVEDAHWVYEAIKLASPGGLGKSSEQDVNSRPTLSLKETMRIASHRDRIALQYVSNFKDVFDFGVLRYNNGFDRWGKKDWAAVWVYTGLLCQYPDSHIERKYSDRYSQLVAAKMLSLDTALADSSKPELLKPLFAKVDQEFKLKGINPGTTADMTVATILAASLINFLSAV